MTDYEDYKEMHKSYIDRGTLRLEKYKKELAKLESQKCIDFHSRKRINGLKKVIKSIEENLITVRMYQSLQRPYGM